MARIDETGTNNFLNQFNKRRMESGPGRFYSNPEVGGTYVRIGDANVSVDDNKVESAPELISRNGMNIKFRTASLSLLYSYTAESFADALNTETPSKNGYVGIVPAYGLFDINTS